MKVVVWSECLFQSFVVRCLIISWGEMVQSFDHGYYLLIKSIQELREKKRGIVTVGVGGPSGSGKTRYKSCMVCVLLL